MKISGHLLLDSKEKSFNVFPELREVKQEKESFEKLITEGIPWGKDRSYFILSDIFTVDEIYYIAFGEPEKGFHPMQCLDCTIEHIAKAMVNCDELDKGYDGNVFKDQPNHFPMAIGNIAEAEAQTARLWPELSNKIRGLKLRFRDINELNYKNHKENLNTLFWEAFNLKNRLNNKIKNKPEIDGKKTKKPCGCGKK